MVTQTFNVITISIYYLSLSQIYIVYYRVQCFVIAIITETNYSTTYIFRGCMTQGSAPGCVTDVRRDYTATRCYRYCSTDGCNTNRATKYYIY